MIPKPFDQIDKSDIDALVTAGQPERRTMEYKQALPGSSDKERLDFFGDVSSFANASGGDLLFGVADKRVDGKPTGIPESAPGLATLRGSADATILQLEQMIRSNIDPRIPGLRTKAIEGFAEGPVLLMHIPKSFAAPHLVKHNDSGRFYSRTSNGKYILDVGEIRAAFALAESVPQKLRAFRGERLAAIVAGETPALLPEGPKLVLHVVPLMALDRMTQVDLTAVEKQWETLRPLSGRNAGWTPRYNFDGFANCHMTRQDQALCQSYVQVFRSGAIEAADSHALLRCRSTKNLPANGIGQKLVDALRDYFAVYKAIGIEPPLVVLPTLLGVKDYFIAYRQETRHVIDRDALLLPDGIANDLAVDASVTLRASLDAMWQASGWERCFQYDVNGNWIEET